MKYVLLILIFCMPSNKAIAKSISYSTFQPFNSYKLSLRVTDDSLYKLSGYNYTGGCVIFTILLSYGRYESQGKKAFLTDALTNMKTEVELNDTCILILHSFSAINNMIFRKDEYQPQPGIHILNEERNNIENRISQLNTTKDSLLGKISNISTKTSVNTVAGVYTNFYFGYTDSNYKVRYYLNLTPNGSFEIKINSDLLSSGIYTINGDLIIFEDKHLKTKYLAVIKESRNIDAIGFPACYHVAMFRKE